MVRGLGEFFEETTSCTTEKEDIVLPLTMQMKIFTAAWEIRMGSCHSKRTRHTKAFNLFNFSQQILVKLYKIEKCGSSKQEAWSKQSWGKAG